MMRSASFLTAKSWRVAEHTIICSRVPSAVIFGICPWMRLIRFSYLKRRFSGYNTYTLIYFVFVYCHPAFSSPSASSRIKKRHWDKSRVFVEIRSSSRPMETKIFSLRVSFRSADSALTWRGDHNVDSFPKRVHLVPARLSSYHQQLPHHRLLQVLLEQSQLVQGLFRQLARRLQ